MDKERREELREECGYIDRVKGDFVRLTTNELRALLDMADERYRYRALLIVAGSLLSEDGDTTEADARALYRRIDTALEGKE